MRKIVASLFSAALATAALPLAAQQAQVPPLSGKLGFVNTERILRDAAPAQRAQKKIEAEFQKRDQELAKIAEQLKRMQDDLDRNSVTMGEAQRRNREREEDAREKARVDADAAEGRGRLRVPALSGGDGDEAPAGRRAEEGPENRDGHGERGDRHDRIHSPERVVEDPGASRRRSASPRVP